MSGAGVKTFTNSTLTAVEMNEYLMQQSVMTFASAAARTTAFSAASITPSAGMMSFLTDIGEMQMYNGASWTKVPTADDEAYAYIYHNTPVTFAAATHTKIPWSVIPNSKNVSLSSGSIIFAKTGIYEFNVGFRLGVGTDDWTGVNLFNASTSSILAYGYGIGQVGGNDPAGASWQFLANITSTANSHDIRVFRGSATMLTSTPNANAGWTYTLTVKRLSS